MDERPTEAVAALFLDESDPALHPEPNLVRGTHVGGYVVDEPIGKGATGVVYSATHPVIGKRVAIKVLRHDLCDDPTSVERFIMEARAVNAIGHPNIVDIFDLGALADGRQFLIMDLLVGCTLRRRLVDGPLPVGEAATIVIDCASALSAAHDKGFVHRDLKPDNVFLVDVIDRRPDVRVLDFGLVKLVAGAHPPGAGVRTRIGTVIGTPAYMSPEQACGKNVDHRTDIYALGAMSFELLSGRRPFEHRNILDLLILHAEAPIPSLQQRAHSIPLDVAQLVEAMLSKRPADRPTLAAVRSVLERFTSAPAVAVAPRPSRRTASEITANERPEQLTIPMRRSEPKMSAAVAMTAMPAYQTTPIASSPGLPKVVPKGTPSATEQVPELAIVDEASAPIAVPPSRMWLVFAIAAVIVAVGGLLLGMSL